MFLFLPQTSMNARAETPVSTSAGTPRARTSALVRLVIALCPMAKPAKVWRYVIFNT